jgi:hypothetical protein
MHRGFHAGLLRGASLLVPAKQRGEWRREWHAELWHVRQACTPVTGAGCGGERAVTAFCLGAFQDAFCLRRHGWRTGIQFASWQGSAAYSVFLFTLALIASCTLAYLLPGVRAELNLPHPAARPDLVLIQNAGYSDNASATIAPAQYRAWKSGKQQYFDDFAFYQITKDSVKPESAPAGPHGTTRWVVARASTNLFALLGPPLLLTALDDDADSGRPRVILSYAMWKREFGADPHVAGTMVRMGQRTARVTGVAPDTSWGLPGKIGAWLLEPDSAFALGPHGYVVAHLTWAGKAEMWAQCVHITAYAPHETEDDLLGVALDERTPGPGAIYMFALFLALLALPAITSVSLGEYSVCKQRTSWSRKLCSWSFLCAKIALLLPLVYFVSLDLAYGRTALESETAVLIQLATCFSLCLFGFRWVLQDQRQRCPVCLRRVEHPAQVGQASRMFLSWNGTELMCMGGHTLLHVPGMPTSWFGTQRWLYLDNSWEFLFAGSGPGIKEGILPGLSPW